jgi:hypothetical protein
LAAGGIATGIVFSSFPRLLACCEDEEKLFKRVPVRFLVSDVWYMLQLAIFPETSHLGFFDGVLVSSPSQAAPCHQ